MGNRWRRTHYLSGLPGWLRFGYSPGWVGRSPTGVSPAAEWIMSSGLIPQYREYLRAGRIPPTFEPYVTGAPVSKEEEIQMLDEQSKVIESQLDTIKKRVEALKKNVSTEKTSYYPYTPFLSTPPPEEDLVSLEDYKRSLEEEIEGADARIKELKKLREAKSST
jgi:hypothetical protein